MTTITIMVTTMMMRVVEQMRHDSDHQNNEVFVDDGGDVDGDGDLDDDDDDGGHGDKYVMMKCLSRKMSTARSVRLPVCRLPFILTFSIPQS